MSKTLLVLAASAYQLAAIATARGLGWRVITTDNVPQNPGHSLADVSYDADTTDLLSVLDIARREHIDGVISPGTDVAVSTAAHVAEQLHLPGPPVAATHVLTNKLAFRNFLSEAGLPHPKAMQISASTLPVRSVFDNASWIIKPNRGSGSKGVFILESASEFARHWRESVDFSSDGMAVLEQYLPGTQHTCEGILRNGLIVFALVTDRDTAAFPYTATTGHRVPSELAGAVQANVVNILQDVLGRLGVSEGPFDCDFVAHDDAVTLIEVTPRLGGNSLSRLVMAAHDFDIVEYAVKQACGVPAEFPPQAPPTPCAILILGVNRAGALAYNKAEFDALQREPWVRKLCLDYAVDHAVEPFINGRHRVGEALLVGKNRTDIDHNAEQLKIRLGLTAT